MPLLNLHEIDFSQPDGEFTYKRQFYQVKHHANTYFFKNKKHTGFEFICLFDDDTIAVSNLLQKSLLQTIEEIFQESHYYIRRCIQYKEALISFGTWYGKYYSPPDNGWIYLEWFNCNPPKLESLDEVLEKPYEYFIEPAATIYEKEVPFIKDKEIFYAFIEKTTKPTEFICGSQLELERLTRLAAFIIPELQPLFEQCSSLQVVYKSENDYKHGGVAEISAEEDWNGEIVLYSEEESSEYDDTMSKQTQKLFDLIFEYNCFTGLDWEYNDGPYGYGGNDPHSCKIGVAVQTPSQHERLEAALELQSWLEGKLPESEIAAYFE